MKKTLIILRLYDLSYSTLGTYGNKESLRVSLGEDNVLTYSLFGGWQDTGTRFSISNLQLKESLPLNPKEFMNVGKLDDKVRSILATGVGSHTVYKSEILNELETKSKNDEVYRTLTLLEAQLGALGEDIPKHLRAKLSSDLDTELFVMKVKAMRSKVKRMIKKL